LHATDYLGVARAARAADFRAKVGYDRFWHEADLAACPLSRRLSGANRTCCNRT